MKVISRFTSVFLTAVLLAILLSPVHAWAYGGGGGGGGGGNSVLDMLFNKPDDSGEPDKPSNSNRPPDSWSPPDFMPPPPDGDHHVIELDIPIRIEPVDTTTNEPVDLVEIQSGFNGHPTSGYTPEGNFVMVDYRDIVSIVYDPNMGWVGISKRWSMKVPLPMTNFIRQVISNALSGAGR